MKKALACGCLMLLAAVGPWVAPLAAGEVFVPFASGATANGTAFRTRLWVSNTSAAPRFFTTAFLATGTDGTQAAAQSTPIYVNPGATVAVLPAAPAGKSEGLIAITGAPQLSVVARLELTDVNSNVLSSATLPVIGSQSALAANALAQLAGIAQEKATGTTTDFSIVNLSAAAAQCTIGAFAGDNTPLSPSAIVSVLPLSHRAFDGVLQTLATGDIADVRFQVSCDHPFYAYAMVYEVGGPQTNVVTPALALNTAPGATGGGSSGGGGTGGGNPPPAGAQTFTAPGVFLSAVEGNSAKSFNLPLTPGVAYTRITVDFDLFLNRWQTPLFNSVVALRRGAASRSNRVLYYGVNFRGDNAKTTLELGYQDQFVKTTGPWKERNHYHIRLDYDVLNRLITLQASEGGVLTYTLQGPAYNFDLSDNGNKVHIDFGQNGIADGAYYPPVGWIFSNLQVSMVPSS